MAQNSEPVNAKRAMSETRRLQISAIITGENAAVDITTQVGRGPKVIETHLAKLHSSDKSEWIEILNDHGVDLRTQLLVLKALRYAIDARA